MSNWKTRIWWIHIVVIMAFICQLKTLILSHLMLLICQSSTFIYSYQNLNEKFISVLRKWIKLNLKNFRLKNNFKACKTILALSFRPLKQNNIFKTRCAWEVAVKFFVFRLKYLIFYIPPPRRVAIWQTYRELNYWKLIIFCTFYLSLAVQKLMSENLSHNVCERERKCNIIGFPAQKPLNG